MWPATRLRSTFPQLGAVQAGFNGLYDAFVTEFNFTGTALVFSTYYGGSGSDSANAIALDKFVNIYVGGQTSFVQSCLWSRRSNRPNAASSTGWLLRLFPLPRPLSLRSPPFRRPRARGPRRPHRPIRRYRRSLHHHRRLHRAQYHPFARLRLVMSATAPPPIFFRSITTPGPLSSPPCRPAPAAPPTTSARSTAGQFRHRFRHHAHSHLLAHLPDCLCRTEDVYLEAADPNSNTGLVAEGSFTPSRTPAGHAASGFRFPQLRRPAEGRRSSPHADTVFAGGLSTVALLFKTP